LNGKPSSPRGWLDVYITFVHVYLIFLEVVVVVVVVAVVAVAVVVVVVEEEEGRFRGNPRGCVHHIRTLVFFIAAVVVVVKEDVVWSPGLARRVCVEAESELERETVLPMQQVRCSFPEDRSAAGRPLIGAYER